MKQAAKFIEQGGRAGRAGERPEWTPELSGEGRRRRCFRLCLPVLLLAVALALPAGAADGNEGRESLEWTIGAWHGVRQGADGGEAAPVRLRVEPILGGAGLVEHLEVTHEGGVYRGFAVNAYSEDENLWLRRYTSAGRGEFAELEGTVDGERSTWRSVSPGRSRESRLTSELIGPNRWRRTHRISEDGGETWRVLWRDDLERASGGETSGDAGSESGVEETSGGPEVPALAGHDPGMDGGHGHHVSGSPYAGQKDSGIAALSRSELEQLEAGAGMGLARAAELNRHPGPKHVLELADEIHLSPRQRTEVQEIFDRMEGAARKLGAEIIEKERLLDRRFEHRHLDEQTLRELTATVAALYGELRFVHLRAHLETAEVLTPEQVAAYDRLRGYATARD